ncbi:MAG: hypothetical protein ACFFC7_15085 [Candidatus Hermodarchaeota archaeon]
MRKLTNFVDQELEEVIKTAFSNIFRAKINSKTIKTLLEQFFMSKLTYKERLIHLQLLRLLIFWYPKSLPVVFAFLVQQEKPESLSFEFWLNQIEEDLFISRFRDFVKIWVPVDVNCPYCATKLLFKHYKGKQRYCVICRQMC